VHSDEGAKRACAQTLTGHETTMALSQTQPVQEASPADTVWTVLDAANDLGDTLTVEACRRVIDANLCGHEAAASDMAIVAAFFS
jgi:hypothetical protein